MSYNYTTKQYTELLKWIALLLMTGDHINKYLFNGTLPYLFEAGRLALPLFIYVLAYNLARPDALARGVYIRTILRLSVFGAIASVPYIALGGLVSGWWPLNIMFTLLIMTLCIYLTDLGSRIKRFAAVLIVILGSCLVEFWFPAVLFGVYTWLYLKKPTYLVAALALISLAALWFINQNFWALAALPLIFVISKLNVSIPRLRWFFYAYYPLHLGIFWLIRMSING